MISTRFQKQDTQGRMIGLGQAPSDQSCASIFNCGFTQVPVIEYVTWTVELPVSDAFLSGTFGDEIDVLQNPKSVPGVTAVDSSFIINGLLQVDMLVVGFGVHVFAEPQQGSAIGNYVDPTPAAGLVPVSPDAFTTNDVTSGAIGLNQGQTMTPAVLEWGAPCQNALWHLVNAYQFQWVMQQRYLLINEMCSDVAYFASYAEAEAAGTSQEAVQRFARRANDKYQAQGATGSFVPINAQRIGSVSTLNGGVNTGVFHPTRAYDEMDVTWGGLRGQGGSACCSPFRKLIRPVLLEKGIPIGMRLAVQDEFHQGEMLRYLSQSDNQGGNQVARVAFANNAGGTTIGTGLPVFPELTLDAAPILVSQQVQTDRILMKGGAMQIAILIKGFEIWGPWKQYVASKLVQQGLVGLPGNQTTLAAIGGQ